MDFNFTDEEKSVSELARKILSDLVSNERLKQHEADGKPFLDELWPALADANLLGVAIPEAHGGMQLGFTALCLLLEEIGRAVAPCPAYPALVLGALPLARFGSAADQREWLPRIARGEAIVTAGLIELDSSDPLHPLTRAERVEGGYRLHGEKSLVPAGRQAARILVSANTDSGTGLFWVTPDQSGVRLETQTSSDGQAYAYLSLAGVALPESARLGSEQDDALGWLVERAIAARCAMQLGVTERALAMTGAYGRERVQFDRPIGSFQAFHQRAADAYIQVEAIRLTAWEAIWKLDHDLPARDAVHVAKFTAADGAAYASYACQHLHGGVGIDVDYPLHRYFKWAIQIEHELGSAKNHLERLGDRLAAGEIAVF